MHPRLVRALAPLGGGALALLAAGALGVLAAPAFGDSPRTVRCDYSTADYRIRELPFRGGFFSPDSRRMAYPEQGEVRIWSIPKRKVVASFRPEDGGPPVTQVLQWTRPRSGGPGRIFFTRGAATGGRPTPDPEDPNRMVYGQVWVAGPDGGRARQVEVELPAGTEVVEYGVPRVSPDGRRVGYTFLADPAAPGPGSCRAALQSRPRALALASGPPR